MNLTKMIDQALERNDHIVVFTQRLEDFSDFAINGNGRWNISHNISMWPNFSSNLMAKGQVRNSFKLGIVEEPLNQPNVIGIDYGGKVTFTKNPFFSIPKDSIIIKPRSFVYPPFTISSYYTPLRAVTEVKDGLV